jgi:hypothetical protein
MPLTTKKQTWAQTMEATIVFVVFCVPALCFHFIVQSFEDDHVGLSLQGVVIMPRELDGACTMFAGQVKKWNGLTESISREHQVFWIN